MIKRWKKRKANRPDPNILVPPEGVPLTLPVAGVGVRLGAQIIDVVLTSALAGAFLMFLIAVDAGDTNTFGLLASLLFFFIRIPYYALSELFWNGQTLGKRMCQIKVIAYDGGPLTPHALVSRNLMKEAEIFLPGTLVFVTGDGVVMTLISLLWIGAAFAVPLASPKRRRLGDLIAGTYVVHLPVPILMRDIAQAQTTIEKPKFVFLPHQLDKYGAFELQTLEDLLRASSNATGQGSYTKNQYQTIISVVRKIRAKIDFAEAVSEGESIEFLQAFYNAQRAHLEQRQLMGERRINKHYDQDIPND